MLTCTIGGVRLTAVIENSLHFPVEMLLPAATREEMRAIEWLGSPYVDDLGQVELCIQAFVVETPAGQRIVVDTCIGNDKPREHATADRLKTDFLQRFEAAGFARESIDYVLCTHLHVDHVGWNTMLENGRWVPTFPNARYLVGRVELEHLRAEGVGDDKALLADSIQPLFDHGLVEAVEVDHRLCAEIRLVSTPGHTPGHVSVAIESEGQQALISGDLLHNPVQIGRPDWGSFADGDPAASEVTRRAMLAELADGPVLLIGTHFPAPSVGKVRRDGAAFRFVH